MLNVNFSHKIECDYNLSNKHGFKKKAGNAKYYYQLIFNEGLEMDLDALHELYKKDISFKIFGLHTNLYITDNGYDGLFVDISPKNDTIIFDKENNTFKITSNVIVSKFVNYTMEMGYDFAAFTGIPGMIGSGVVGNSGWNPTKKSFSDYVQEITLYDFKEGKEITVKPDENFFGDRDSFIKRENRYKTRYFVKEVILKSEFIGKELVKKKYNEQINKRSTSLKFGFEEGCAGSLWSNAHLRKQIGKSFPDIVRENDCFNCNYNGAKYSDYGSRFFITGTNTNDKDVAKLFSYSINKIKELFNITLHKEVLILDSDGEIDTDTFIKRNS